MRPHHLAEGQGKGCLGTERRIDPVRACIDSIPYARSGFHHGDVVLHDGDVVGHRKHGDADHPLFDVLELFEASGYRTVIAEVEIREDADLEKLEQLFAPSPHEFEDWTTNVGKLCEECTEGTPHEHQGDELATEWTGERTLGLAVLDGAYGVDGADARGDSVLQLFDRWQRLCAGRLVGLDGGSDA